MIRISPSSYNMFYQDIETWYARYMSPHRVREPQNLAMALGSAFDARIKSRFIGTDFRELFDKQVENKSLVDEVLTLSAQAMNHYDSSGAFKYLENALSNASFVSFEGDVSGAVDDIAITGKPDLYWKDKDGQCFVLDWKVTGWTAKTIPSPKKLYVRVWPNGSSHRDVMIRRLGQVEHGLDCISEIDKGWATQLLFYGWLCFGNAPFVGCIDAVMPHKVACYRNRISGEFVRDTVKNLRKMHDEVSKGCPSIPAERRAALEARDTGSSDQSWYLNTKNSG